METQGIADTCCKRSPTVCQDTRTGDTIIACDRCGRTVEMLGTARAVKQWNRLTRRAEDRK